MLVINSYCERLAFVLDEREAKALVEIVDGKPFCFANEADGSYVKWGQLDRTYDSLSCLRFVQGKPLYVAWRDHRAFVVWDDHESLSYDMVDDPSIADGKPLFRARRSGRYLVVWGEREYGPYDKVDQLKFSEGNLLFQAQIKYKTFPVWNGEEIRVYPNVDRLLIARGEPLYSVRSADGFPGEQFVVWGQREFKRHHQQILDLRFVEGKPFYGLGYGSDKNLIVWGDQEYETPGLEIFPSPTVIRGRLCYVVRKKGKQYLVWGNRKIRTDDGLTLLMDIGGQPVGYCVDSKKRPRSRSRHFLIWGKNRSEDFDSIMQVQTLRYRPLFVAEKARKWFVVWGDKVVSRKFDQVVSLQHIKGRVSFYGRRGRRLYRVTVAIEQFFNRSD